ncbi:MAG: hypothetical protein KF746_00375 [Chitinophagaceae bacterium]|nr:hypothetical protein [Chitinophagaceae bacterium]
MNQTTGFVSAFNGIYKTIDGGLTWNKVFNQGGRFICFPEPGYGYVLSFNGILKTTNEGSTWALINKQLSQEPLDLHFATGHLGFFSIGNEIYKTEDGGNSWTRTVKIGITEERLIELHFTDENHGWACGFKGTVLRYEK